MLSRSLLALVVATSCALAPVLPLMAAEPAVSATVSAADLARAANLVSSGYQAMQASNQDPSKSVDAALAFAEAQPIYESAGQFDRVREMNANIFWCRKRMNHDELERYVAGRGIEVTRLVERIETVVNTEVPLDQAEKWLQEADLFSIENPDQSMAIAIRYFEVAERFVGSPSAITAQRKSLDYQAKAGAAAKQAHRDTLFTRPVDTRKGQQAIPDAKDLRTAVTRVKKDYKEGYADRSENGRRTLAKALFDVAQRTADDPLMAYALYSEAIDLACDTKDVDSILTFAEAQAKAFAMTATEAKKEALGRLRLDSVAKAVLVLLDNPSDPAANTVAGRYYAFTLRRWDVGFAMLSVGEDIEYARLAEMEIAKPQGVAQELELAEAWFALGGPKNVDTVAAWARAMHWFEHALPSLDGATKRRTEDRMNDMFGTVFPRGMNWGALTAEQWGKLKPVASVVVAANTPKTDTKVVLRTGQKARVVPSPTDTWFFYSYFSNGMQELSYKGREFASATMSTLSTDSDYALPLGSMIMWIDENSRQQVGEISGPGHIVLRSAQPQYASKGQIRVKIILLDE
jgi:hypothetical protein